eukprot:5182937-Amphidinium_carterae.1
MAPLFDLHEPSQWLESMWLCSYQGVFRSHFEDQCQQNCMVYERSTLVEVWIRPTTPSISVPWNRSCHWIREISTMRTNRAHVVNFLGDSRDLRECAASTKQRAPSSTNAFSDHNIVKPW